MKTSYWFLAIIAILMWNGILIKRDQKMFDSYAKACSQLPIGHPDCSHAKPIK